MSGKITVAEVMALKPCDTYPRHRVIALWAGREALTAMEVLDLVIPEVDRLWLLLREWAFDDKTLRLMAADFAEAAVLSYWPRVWDFRPAAAVVAARRFARGEIGEHEANEASAASASAMTEARVEARVEASWASVSMAAAAARAAAAASAAGEAGEASASRAASWSSESASVAAYWTGMESATMTTSTTIKAMSAMARRAAMASQVEIVRGYLAEGGQP